MVHFAFADSVAASSLPFVVLASKSDVVPTHNGVRDPVLERYEIHKATPESPRSQKMCIALVLRSVVNNKCGKCCSFARFMRSGPHCLLFFFFFPLSFPLIIYGFARNTSCLFPIKQLLTLVVNLGAITPFWRSTHGRANPRHQALLRTAALLTRPPIKRGGMCPTLKAF